MILTHADQCNEEAIIKFEGELKTHPQSKEIADYCELGFAPIGALDFLEFEAIKRQQVKEGLLEDKTERIIKMRDNLLKIFIDNAGQDKMLICEKLNSAVQTAEVAKKQAIEVAVKGQGKCIIQ